MDSNTTTISQERLFFEREIKTDGLLEDLEVAVVDKRFYYLCISNALKEKEEDCIIFQSSPQDSFKFLIKYLATISDGEVHALAKAKLEAVRAVFEVIKLPGLFETTFHNYPAVVQLQEDDNYEIVYELLKIFRTQELEAYMAFYTENSVRLEKLGLQHKKCGEKMRLLTLMELCDADLEYSFDDEVNEIERGIRNEDDAKNKADNENKDDGYKVSFAEIQDTLKISANDVKSWVDKAVNANLMECTIDETNRAISVSRCNERLSDLNDWPSIRLKGIDWTKIHTIFGKKVVKQTGDRCWSIACAGCISFLCYHEHKRRKVFRVSSQELLERVIKANPGIESSEDFEQDEATKTYGLPYPYGFQFCMQYGVGLKAKYPTRPKRDINKSFPPAIHEKPRVFIKGFQWLGDCKGRKHRNKIFKALYKQPLIGNIDCTRSFERHKSGIFTGSSEDIRNRHSVVIVGVNIQENYFIILNSWGREWGENGFARVSCDLIDSISRPYGSSIEEIVPQKPRLERRKFKYGGATCGPNQSTLTLENREDIQVVKYECGRNNDLKEVAAVLLYLFDVVKGGETGFCKLEESSRRKSSKSNGDIFECAKQIVAVTLSESTRCSVIEGERWSARSSYMALV